MAAPIGFDVPRRDPRVAAQSRLPDAPAEYADALLAGYQVLQGLYEAGVLDVLRGLLGSREEVIDIVVRALGGPGILRAVRNLVLLAEMLGTIDPGVLRAFTRAVPEAMTAMAERPGKPGLWGLLKDVFRNDDFRHGVAAVDIFVKTFGKNLSEKDRCAPAR
jgi:uncharacterized protein YjgD (DUF1641 family)